MKISANNRESLIDIPEILVDSFIKQMKDENMYEEYYLKIFNTYKDSYNPNFMSVDDYVKNHTHKNYCEAIIRDNGMIEDAQPSHEIALLLAYPLMTEDELCLSLYNIVEYTGYIRVYYDVLHMPTCITKEQYNTIIRLIESGCISSICENMLKNVKILG